MTTHQLLVNVDVDDLARATRFYTEAFDLRVGRRLGPSVVELVGASTHLYLLEKPSGSPTSATSSETRRYTRHWTPIHLDFVVPSLELASELALRAGAVMESGIQEAPYGRIAYFSDPFGHGFCLLEFSAAGYDAIAT